MPINAMELQCVPRTTAALRTRRPPDPTFNFNRPGAGSAGRYTLVVAKVIAAQMTSHPDRMPMNYRDILQAANLELLAAGFERVLDGKQVRDTVRYLRLRGVVGPQDPTDSTGRHSRWSIIADIDAIAMWSSGGVRIRVKPAKA